MWLSHVEIEDYSIAYFDHITTFEALYSKHCIAELNLKVGLIRLHNASDSPASMKHIWALPLMKCSNTVLQAWQKYMTE